MNNCTFTGYVSTDPELKEVAGTPVLSFRFKNKVGYGDKAKDFWLTVSIWGKRGETLSSMIRNGSYLTIQGEITAREYQKDGQTRTTLELRANDVDLPPRAKVEPQHQSGAMRNFEENHASGAYEAKDVGDEIPF